MNKLLLLATCLFFCAATKVTAQTQKTETLTDSTKSGARFKFSDGDVYDFGEVSQGPDAIHEFVFINTGNTPLIIVDAKPSCSCTTPEWPRDSIAPGATGIIKVGYHTTKSGPFFKDVYIQSNAMLQEGEKRYTISIKGVVK